MILAFPCNQFGQQDPWEEEKILAFAREQYGITFPMFSKTEVNGPNTHPLYQYIKDFGDGEFHKDLRWNFTKFLIDRSGHVIKRFEGKTEPGEMEADIIKLLSKEAN